jgi:hypothetical protein
MSPATRTALDAWLKDIAVACDKPHIGVETRTIINHSAGETTYTLRLIPDPAPPAEPVLPETLPVGS